MRDIKFRYFFKVHTRDGLEINAMDLQLKEIEQRIFSYRDEDLIGVMQYTGLKDKNGVEIYEGDKVLVGEGERELVVSYSDKDAGFVLMHDGFVMVYNINYTIVEVIGNLHQNPELLEA